MNNRLDPYLTMLEYHTSVSRRMSHCFFPLIKIMNNISLIFKAILITGDEGPNEYYTLSFLYQYIL